MTTSQAPGLNVAVHGHPNQDTLLLWHPAVRTDPDGVSALASRIAGRSGLRVVVPTWADGKDLLRSVRYARQSSVHPPDRLAVVGYAEAGIAALGLAQNQRRLGIGLVRATCVDGVAGLIDPITGQPLRPPSPAPVATAIDVVEGSDPTGAQWARVTVQAWQEADWEAVVVPADQFTWRVG